jgi:hypothetical protein
VCARWSDLLFSPGGSCIALPLQLRLVSSFPRRVGQLSLVLNAALCPTKPALGSTTCPALGGWLVTPLLLSALVLHPTFTC